MHCPPFAVHPSPPPFAVPHSGQLARLELGPHVLDDARDGGQDLGVGLVVGRVGAVPGVVHAEVAGGHGIRVEGAEESQGRPVGVGAGEALEPLDVDVVDGQHEVVAVEPARLEAACDVLAPAVVVVAVAAHHRGGARVHAVAELLCGGARGVDDDAVGQPGILERLAQQELAHRRAADVAPAHDAHPVRLGCHGWSRFGPRSRRSLIPPSSPPPRLIALLPTSKGPKLAPCGVRVRNQSRSNQAGTPSRNSARDRRAGPCGDASPQRRPGHPRQVDEVALLGQARLVGPRADDDAEQRQRPGGQRLGRERRRVERAQAGARDEHHAAADALVAQPRGEVGQRAAALVEPHQQAAGALDEDDLRLGGDLADPLRVRGDRGERHTLAPRGGLGRERVAQPHELVGRDVVTDEAAHLVDVPGRPRRARSGPA